MREGLLGPVFVIAGPTAVGKSEVADLLAKTLNGAVVSADSMQVYQGMDIGTAKVPVGERKTTLYMVDVVEPSVSYSAALYQHDARLIINELLTCGKPPILCGGTGLYIDAALDDMHFPSGDIEAKSRSKYQKLAEELGAEGLHSLLTERDSESARVIHPNNVRRVIRALEMHDEGVSYAEQRKGFASPCSVYSAYRFALTMPRDLLYERINQRVDRMFEQGLLEEVKSLVDAGARDALTSRQAIGYKELIEYLDGSITLSEAQELIKQRSRRYAKRQLSWFKRDKRFTWINMSELTSFEAVQLILNSSRSVH